MSTSEDLKHVRGPEPGQAQEGCNVRVGLSVALSAATAAVVLATVLVVLALLR